MAEEKPMPKHKKAYKDSPTLKRKEDGKMGISRGEKKAAEENSGTEGIPEHEKAAMEVSHKHEKERLELHQKHEKEHHALRSKHMMSMKEKEGSAAEEAGESKAEAKSEKTEGEE